MPYFDNLHWLVATTLTSKCHASLSLFSVFTVYVSVAGTRIRPVSIDLQLCNSVVPGCCQGKALQVAVVAGGGWGRKPPPPPPPAHFLKGTRYTYGRARNDRWHDAGGMEYYVLASSKGWHAHLFGLYANRKTANFGAHFLNRKLANFWGVPVHKSQLLKFPMINPQTFFVYSPQIANPQICKHVINHRQIQIGDNRSHCNHESWSEWWAVRK